MYAVIETGGKQYRVAQGQTLDIEKLPYDEGSEITFEKILMLSTDKGLSIGSPYVPDAKITARVIAQTRGKKIRIIKHRRRKNYHREKGHRQYLTRIEITGI